MPHPDRGREVLQRNAHTDETVSLIGIVRGSELEHPLLLRTQVDFLQMTALVQVPDVNLITILATQQQLRVDAVFYHVRRAPFGRNHRVVSQVPPEVVSQLLWATMLFPGSFQL